MRYQACNACGGPVREGKGALCVACTRDARRVTPRPRVAAERAGKLLQMTAAKPEPMLARVAAAQLAAAWGITDKRGKARC